MIIETDSETELFLTRPQFYQQLMEMGGLPSEADVLIPPDAVTAKGVFLWRADRVREVGRQICCNKEVFSP